MRRIRVPSNCSTTSEEVEITMKRRHSKSNPRRRRAFGGSMHYGDPEGAYGPPAVAIAPGPGTQGWHRFGGLYRHGDYAFDGVSPFVGGDVLVWHESRRAWENLGHAADIDGANDLIARRVRPNRRRTSRRNAKRLVSPVPALDQWNMSAGGTSAREGTHGYSYKGPADWVTEFHIWPPAIRRRGYTLSVFALEGDPGWKDYGVFRTPAMAAKRARELAVERGIQKRSTPNRRRKRTSRRTR